MVESETGPCPAWISIPMPFTEDIVGIVKLLLRFVVEILKKFEEKDDLFAIFPIGATIQDGGKRRRSNVTYLFIIQEIKETKRKEKN